MADLRKYISIVESANTDPIIKQANHVLNQLIHNEPAELLTDDELEGWTSPSDRGLIHYFLKTRVPGITDINVEAARGDDGLQGVKFVFTANGATYQGNWFYEAGSYSVSRVS